MSSEALSPRPVAGTMPRVVLDTDAFNEIDDQFAISYLLKAADRADTEAIYAAPYSGRSASSPADGVQKSFEEINRIKELLGSTVPSFAGSARFLEPNGAVESNAASDLVERAMTATHSDPLTVIAIGALTNIASSLIRQPEISERIRVVWLGGHAPSWPHNEEFNLSGDIAAAQTVFDSGVPLYVVPCLGVASHLRISLPELEHHTNQSLPIAGFLRDRFKAVVPDGLVRTRVIWDISAIAWVTLPESVKNYQVATPRIAGDGSYVTDPRRHHCRFAYHLDRDAIFADLFTRLSA